VMVIYVPTSPDGAHDVAAALNESQAGYDGPVTLLSVFMQSDGGSLDLGGDEGRLTIPSFTFPEAAALALARAVRYGTWRQRDTGVEAALGEEAVGAVCRVVAVALGELGDGGGWLSPDQVNEVLNAAGLRTPRTYVAATAEEAVNRASEVDGPVVLKVISDSALHKSDVGGVVLGVEGESAVREGFATVTGVVDDADGALIQEFVDGGHEVLIGMTQDRNFGPLVGFGLGGVYVELLQDVAFRIHPLTDADAAEMIRETKGFKLLEGYRNMVEGDIVELERALLKVSGLISAVPEMVEMDLNPVKVLEPGEGVCVVDARIRVEPIVATEHPDMRDLPGVTS